ncbi:MAG: site-specific DNA-methyltransferase [Clostridium sp.]|nr:site-specific DNA-methyltransferase [Clostridium sp.]
MNDKLDGLSMDIEAANKAKLQAVFPECFIEGRLDIDKLLALCGEYITDDYEKYEFKWKGKSECLRLAQRRSTATLRPCPAESVNFDTTQNLYIEGDNLEVLKLLQKSYFRKVKLIYIDPPYNTGSDFVYEDDFADPMRRYVEVTQQTTRSNPETVGRYHTNWLNMMYPRLRLAANLLRDDGVIFISIDDNEVDNLKKLCNEVFGEENFAGQFPWRKRTAKSDVPFGISQDYEWILCYAKTTDFIAGLQGGTRKYFETDDLPDKPWRIHDLSKQTSASERPNSFFTIVNPKTGEEYPANPNRTWAITQETFEKYYSENRIVFPGDYEFLNISKPALRYFQEDDIAKAGTRFGYISVSTKLPDNIGMTQDGTKEITEMFEGKVFGFPKPLALIKHFITMATAATKDDKNIILDFFSGSATTAHAVMQLNAEDGGNRRFIMVQLPEICGEKTEAYKAGYQNICEIGKERIRRAGKKLLETMDGQMALNGGKPPLDVGFKVFKLDTSNMKLWDAVPIEDGNLDTLFDRIAGHIDGLKADRSDEDLIFEILLKMGYPLTAAIANIDIGGLTVYKVADGEMLICLQEGATASHVERMAALLPQKIVFAERSLADSSAKVNAFYLLESRGIELKTL